MKKFMAVISVCVFTFGMVSTVVAGPTHVLTVQQGQVIPGRASGELIDLDGKNFEYQAPFHLNVAGLPTQTEDGYTMYELNNGTDFYTSAAIADGPTYSSNTVFIGFDNNLSANWVSDPELSWLNLGALGIVDGTEIDIVELLHNDTETGIEVTMNLLFDSGYFSSENLPTTIDQADVIKVAGAFIKWDSETSDQEIGIAEFVVSEFAIGPPPGSSPDVGQPGSATVPAPGAFILAGLGAGLVGTMRRRRSL